ncbi:hypothetical protein MSWH1_2059 [Methanosarcina sp. WH1]|nr:hypothetical protein MSWH1_2059 [Methanosarcina sp. WH1]
MLYRRRKCPICGEKMKLHGRASNPYTEFGVMCWHCLPCKMEFNYMKTAQTCGKYLFLDSERIKEKL